MFPTMDQIQTFQPAQNQNIMVTTNNQHVIRGDRQGPLQVLLLPHTGYWMRINFWSNKKIHTHCHIPKETTQTTKERHKVETQEHPWPNGRWTTTSECGWHYSSEGVYDASDMILPVPKSITGVPPNTNNTPCTYIDIWYQSQATNTKGNHTRCHQHHYSQVMVRCWPLYPPCTPPTKGSNQPFPLMLLCGPPCHRGNHKKY